MSSVRLKNLRKGEVVDIVIRRHWIIFLFLFIYLIATVVVTVGVFVILGFTSLSILMMLVFWMVYSIFLYIQWINYELDIFVFTNNRVICVEQKTFLNRSVGETTLDKVQEIDVQTKWLLANILDFGTLRILTAGSSPSFDMTYSPHPLKNSRHINNLVDRYRDGLYGWKNGNKMAKDNDDIEDDE